ncbi:MAG: hypothetical protein ACRC18_06740 [Cetobacterium sp.]
MKKKYTITSGAESSVEVDFMFDENELKIVSEVLRKLEEDGLKEGYCPYFYIEDEKW